MDQREVQAIMARQAEVHGDRERLEAYGATIPEVWREAQYDGQDLVALLTEPDVYRSRLLALVEHPDRLTVRFAPYSRQELRRIGDEVLQVVGSAPDHLIAAGPGDDHFHVDLRAGESALAEQLRDRFGAVVRIRLGQHPFPLPTTPPATVRPAPAATVEIPDLAFETTLRQPTSRPGSDISGEVRLRNTSTTKTVRFETGSSAVGVTLHRDGTRAGGFNGVIAGVGRGVELAPGATTAIGFVAGSDSIDPTVGAALPPGRYLLVVPLGIVLDGRRETLVPPPVDLYLED